MLPFSPEVRGKLRATCSCALIFSEISKFTIIMYATRARIRKPEIGALKEVKALNPLPAVQSKRCNNSLQNGSPGADNRSGPMGAIF